MSSVSPYPPSRPKVLPWLIGMVCLSGAMAQAQSAPAAPAADKLPGAVTVAMLPGVVISGSRNERFIDDLALSMDVFGVREMEEFEGWLDEALAEEAQMGDIRDVAQGMPNV